MAGILAALLLWLETLATNPAAVSPQQLTELTNQLRTEVMALDPTPTPAIPEPVTVDRFMAWWYPGEPACTAVAEARTAELDVVKPEFFVIRAGGELEFMTEAAYGCNGYTEARAAEIRDLAPEQFVMVSASYAPEMDAFLQQDTATGEHVERLVTFVVENQFTGVELDFEDFGGWTPEIYERYKVFVTRLGTALHAKDKQLMIDLPAVRNDVEEAWYTLRLAELEQLPVDYLVVMGYDYQFDHGVGQPVAPLTWLREVVHFSLQRLQDDSKLVIGIPAYGYVGNFSDSTIRIMTHEQASAHRLFDQATRDSSSAEFIATGAREVLVYSDATSVAEKIKTIGEAGVGVVSIWHLGGNLLPELPLYKKVQ